MEHDQDASSASLPEANNQDIESEAEKTLSYETYRKTVETEKRAREKARSAQEEARRYKDELEALKKAQMKEKEDYKALYEHTNQTLEQLKRERDQLEGQQLTAKRLNVFDEKIGKLKHNDFYKLLPIDEIMLDDDGNPIEESVKLVGEKIRAKYGDDIFLKKETGRLPTASGGLPELKKDFSNLSKMEKEAELKKALGNIITNRR